MPRSPVSIVFMLAFVLATLVSPSRLGAGTGQDGRRGKEAFARAVALEKEGNYVAALPLLWEAAGLAPEDGDIQQRLGEALERIGALDAAVDAYARALHLHPDSRKTANSLILALVKAGRGPEAVARARAIVDTAPRDPDAYFTLGLAQAEQDVDGAIASFRRALELDANHALARYNLALVLKRTDRLNEAVAELKRAIAIEPRAEAYYALGVIYWHQGDADGAVRELRAAIARQPEHADAHYTLGAVLRWRGDVTGAVDALRRAIALRPDLWSAHYLLAQVYQAAGNDHAASSQLQHAERLRREAEREREAGVWTAVGTGRLDAGDPAGALAQFERAISTCETYAPAHYQRGRALSALGRHGEARAAFARAHALNPGLVPPDTR